MKLIFIYLLFILNSYTSAWATDNLDQAALSGNKEKLMALIASGAEVKGFKGGKALYYAALKGKYEIAEVLVKHGADVNVQIQDGATTLHMAVSYQGNSSHPASREMPPMDIEIANDKLKIVELLIRHGADVNSQNKRGDTPLDMAATSALAKLLIKHGANVHGDINGNGSWPLLFAVSNNRYEVVEVLIDHKADVNLSKKSSNTPLFAAIFNNRIELVRLLINKNANVNYRTSDGQSMLEAAILYAGHNAPGNVAAINNQRDIVKLLIKKGADINSKNRYGQTPLVVAINNNKPDLAKLLLAKDVKINEITDSYTGRTELYSAIRTGNASLVELMLKKGAKVNDSDNEGQSPLSAAVTNNQLNIANILIKHGANVNLTTNKGYPLLHYTNKLNMLELLLKNKANANSKDQNGDTFLWKVCYESKPTNLLLSHGADINIKNSQGRTALHLASRFARDDVAKRLIVHGANINVKDDYYGQTPLFHAVRSFEKHPSPIQPPVLNLLTSQNTRTENSSSFNLSANDLNNAFPSQPDTSSSISTVKILVAHGANINATDNQGQRPLHVSPTKEGAEQLLKYGAPVDAKRSDGATALHLAAVYGRKDIVQTLLEHSANVNTRTNNGITPLHYAKGIETFKLLIASGADVNAVDSNGNTPLYMASESSTVKFMIQHGAKINIKNSIGQTPLLRSINIFISNIEQHDLLTGPLGESLVVAHGGSIDLIKALLDQGSNVNLDDPNGYMPLYYVRNAIRSYKSYAEITYQLIEIERLLQKHGAILEKNENTKNRILQ